MEPYSDQERGNRCADQERENRCAFADLSRSSRANSQLSFLHHENLYLLCILSIITLL